MKNILKAFLATVIAILSLSCEKQEQQGDVNIDGITISLDVDEVTLASASLRVRHNGGSEATWTYVVTSDLESDADALIDAKVERDDVEVFYIPATQMAKDEGIGTLANMIILGHFLECNPNMSFEGVETVVESLVPPKKAALKELNMKALSLGKNYK